MGLSRRAFLGGAAGAMALGAAVVDLTHPGAYRWVRDQLHPPPSVPLPTDAPGLRVSGSMRSAAMGTTVGWTIAYPPGHFPGDKLPMCVAMPGRGSNHSTPFDAIGLDRYLARVVGHGTKPFAVAAVDGGDHSYWHRRATGEDPQAMLLTEFLPLMKSRGLRTSRFAMMGWSMGGYGALLVAEKLGSSRVAAVAASSPALWHKASETPGGAFDSAEDFNAHDVFAGRPQLAGIPVRLACGQSDPFLAATKSFARGVPLLKGADFRIGGHTDSFWRDTAAAQLAFVGSALA